MSYVWLENTKGGNMSYVGCAAMEDGELLINVNAAGSIAVSLRIHPADAEEFISQIKSAIAEVITRQEEAASKEAQQLINFVPDEA